ncbi:unnamed protein product [Cyclocybe aegerita]|uniref:F-box domain-containing protein n=1 Tax=Cyclocybe aegerita TaxID=1973307 RepID=A0A8S0W495_CYCAE|nr:unnamed protein product [Cyclocybe aegerita]
MHLCTVLKNDVRFSFANLLEHSVPPEILSETFSHLIDGDSRNVILPSHVCSLWRETALQDTSLWTYIRLGDKNEYKRIALAFLKTCIARARGRLLSISVKPHNQYVSPNAYIFAIYESLMIQNDGKWESFSLTTTKITDCVLLFAFLARESAPTVKTLSATCLDRKNDYPIDGLLPQKLLGLQALPILQHLTLDFSHQFRQAKASVFWDRLTSLKVTSKMRSAKYLSILRLCVNLESCSISPETRDDRDALKGSYEPVHLAKLKKLEIFSYWVPSLVAVQLVCPALEEAIIQFEVRYHEEAELASFFKKCAATLQVLKVPGSFCRVEKWARPLENLQELTVTGGYDWDDVNSDHGATMPFREF